MKPRLLLLLLPLAACAREQTAVEKALEENARGLEIRRVEGQLQLECAQPDAEVLLDGVLQGSCADFAPPDRWLALDEGEHRVEVRKPGFVPYRADLMAGRARTSLRVDLTPMN